MQAAYKSLPRFHAVASMIIIISLWWIIGASGIVNQLFLPRIQDVVVALAKDGISPDLYRDLGFTVLRASIGLAVSILFAVPSGIALGRFPQLYKFFDFPIDFFRSIPSSALFFLFIMIFGIGNASKIAVVFYGCSLILLVGTIYGARPTREKQDRVNMLQVFGASRFQIFYLAVLRDALPHIAASIRVCVSMSLVLVIVTEMFLGANDGLGHRLYDNYLAYRVPEMYGVLLVLGSLGFGANKLSVAIENRIVFWFPATSSFSDGA